MWNGHWRKSTNDREENYEANISVTILELVGAFMEEIKKIIFNKTTIDDIQKNVKTRRA
jgi:hypothetical protein